MIRFATILSECDCLIEETDESDGRSTVSPKLFLPGFGITTSLTVLQSSEIFPTVRQPSKIFLILS